MILLALGVSVAMIAWLLWSLRAQQWQGRFDWLSLSLGLFALALLLSTIFSVQPYVSLFGMSGTQSDTALASFYFILFAFLLRQTTDESCGRFYLSLFLTSGALASLLSFIHLAGVPLFPGTGIPEAFHPLAGSPGVLALLSVLQFFLAWQLWRNTSHAISRVLLSLVMSIHLLVLLFVDVYLAALCIVAGVVLLLLTRVVLKQRPFADAWIIAAMLVGILLLSLSVSKYSGKSYGVDITMPASSSARVSLSTLSSQPILGSGPSTFYYDLVSYRPIDLNTSSYADVRFSRPDNYWLQVFAGTGILGGLLFLWLLARLVWQSSGTILDQKKKQGDFQSLAIWFFLLNLLIIFFTPGSMLVSLSLWLSIGILGMYGKEKTAQPSNKFLRGVVAFSLLLFVGLWYGQLRVWFGSVYITQARTAILNTEPLQSVQATIDHAISLDPWRATYRLDSAEHALVSAQLSEDQTLQKQLALSAVDPIEQAISLDPKNPVVYEQALRYIPAIRLLAGTSPLAEQDMLEALIAIEPNNVKHYRNWAKLELVSSQQLAKDESTAGQADALLQSAYTHLTKALDLAPGDLDTRYHLALTHELLGNEALARDMLRTLAMDYPNDPDVLFELARHEGLNGDYNKAIQLLTTVVNITPRNVQVRLALAQAYQAIDETESALSQVNTALQLDPENVDAQSLLSELQGSGNDEE